MSSSLQFLSINAASIELIKIFAVSFGWIGSLVVFMWLRERVRKTKAAKFEPSIGIAQHAA
ncbi:MAG: hypothetical protein KGO82_14060 [Bacteroidota bacterium]|nr:hypothetical protein [Bacteroidota bacterium]